MMNYYLQSTNDNTDRTADIMALLEQYGVCRLGCGTFVVSGVDMPDNTSLFGEGAATRVVLDERVEDGFAVRIGSFCTVKDLHLIGDPEADARPAGVGKRHGLLFFGTATTKEWAGQDRNSIVNGCVITGFSGGGITCHGTGYETRCCMTVSDCHIMYCGAGINIDWYSEFHKFTNVLSERNYYGCINNGGNNMFVNCGFTSNGTGFLIDNSHGKSKNNSHGSVVGCTINHSGKNKGIGIQILGAKNGFIFTGCQMFYSKIVVEDSDGIVFDTFNFGRDMDISVKGGRFVMFSNCGFAQYPASIKRRDDAKLRFANCYTWDGEEVSCE